MQDTETLSRILKLEKPWQVESIEIDEPSNRLDIVITYSSNKRSLFGRRSNHSQQARVKLRHLPIAGRRTFLHVPDPETVPDKKLWSPAGSRLTVEMENQLIDILNICNSKQLASRITGISLAEVRQVSERTGAGNATLDETSSPSNTGVDAKVEHLYDSHNTRSFELVDDGDVPVETAACWQELMTGELSLKDTPVALQMLLQKIRQNIASNPTEITRVRSAQLLRQYFIKNKSRHVKDIDILFNNKAGDSNANTAAINRGSTDELPAIDHPAWRSIISGELQITTSNIALQMMIERVRQSTERNPTESSCLAAIKILRQFFTKHRKLLQQEITQLGQITGHPLENSRESQLITVPDLDMPCWQQLIDGELSITTNAIGLQMMIERVRQSVAKNNSTANRKAGVKILRQYFLKHQTSSTDEIKQLNSGKNAKVDIQTVKEMIPPESHPNWQRMINGDLQINTEIVALKMMLQSIRLSIENNPGESSRFAGAKILRQYFIKHQNKHKTELAQLIAA